MLFLINAKVQRLYFKTERSIGVINTSNYSLTFGTATDTLKSAIAAMFVEIVESTVTRTFLFATSRVSYERKIKGNLQSLGIRGRSKS